VPCTLTLLDVSMFQLSSTTQSVTWERESLIAGAKDTVCRGHSAHKREKERESEISPKRPLSHRRNHLPLRISGWVEM
jgi:hypothetical protein